MAIRVVIKGKAGEGKTALANAIREMLTAKGVSCTLQDGVDQKTEVHKVMREDKSVAPVTVSIIVKQG